MKAPSFWWRSGSLKARMLAPLATLYGNIAARRLARRGREAGLPVVCIGNLTLGGAGKTPAAMMVARMLHAASREPAFLTRGYGGKLKGPVRVQARQHDAGDVGDEALLLARVAPTVVARDRVAGAGAVRALGAGSIVMDDGFQNPSLLKHLSLLVVDARRGIGNGQVFPAGPLRAPLVDQLERAHALIVVGTGAGANDVVAAARGLGLPVFVGRLVPDPAAVATLAGRKALAFAGIGDPEKFFATIAAAGIEAPVKHPFPDHHAYTEREAASLLAAADRSALVLLTTEKDLSRLSAAGAPGALAKRARALPVSLVLDEADRFLAFMLDSLPRRVR